MSAKFPGGGEGMTIWPTVYSYRSWLLVFGYMCMFFSSFILIYYISLSLDDRLFIYSSASVTYPLEKEEYKEERIIIALPWGWTSNTCWYKRHLRLLLSKRKGADLSWSSRQLGNETTRPAQTCNKEKGNRLSRYIFVFLSQAISLRQN